MTHLYSLNILANSAFEPIFGCPDLKDPPKDVTWLVRDDYVIVSCNQSHVANVKCLQNGSWSGDLRPNCSAGAAVFGASGSQRSSYNNLNHDDDDVDDGDDDNNGASLVDNGVMEQPKRFHKHSLALSLLLTFGIATMAVVCIGTVALYYLYTKSLKRNLSIIIITSNNNSSNSSNYNNSNNNKHRQQQQSAALKSNISTLAAAEGTATTSPIKKIKIINQIFASSLTSSSPNNNNKNNYNNNNNKNNNSTIYSDNNNNDAFCETCAKNNSQWQVGKSSGPAISLADVLTTVKCTAAVNKDNKSYHDNNPDVIRREESRKDHVSVTSSLNGQRSSVIDPFPVIQDGAVEV
ncbi:hypothetical protein HELRODRAFT_191892 [Helobdella robusta]|uniref:Sushi domain-containing protein n=1 Tax=Helobdella robusta TaxID=6412 RepID=T1FTE3_HELRO|nr:hypothetical protein HELRODRAFT_191892 [Helobdella robusta]ESO03621.1 hypothetical protein HELRODRAFT_191892 [Helobdella robusta]